MGMLAVRVVNALSSLSAPYECAESYKSRFMAMRGMTDKEETGDWAMKVTVNHILKKTCIKLCFFLYSGVNK